MYRAACNRDGDMRGGLFDVRSVWAPLSDGWERDVPHDRAPTDTLTDTLTNALTNTLTNTLTDALANTITNILASRLGVCSKTRLWLCRSTW